mmetsp:Transcript_17784/g.43497  ORF Transcript_17784/g.43497 Transcript_17784/m.43497 type:complete len:544 (-) Transcript_17784:243-1874(-)
MTGKRKAVTRAVADSSSQLGSDSDDDDDEDVSLSRFNTGQDIDQNCPSTEPQSPSHGHAEPPYPPKKLEYRLKTAIKKTQKKLSKYKYIYKNSAREKKILLHAIGQERLEPPPHHRLVHTRSRLLLPLELLPERPHNLPNHHHCGRAHALLPGNSANGAQRAVHVALLRRRRALADPHGEIRGVPPRHHHLGQLLQAPDGHQVHNRLLRREGRHVGHVLVPIHPRAEHHLVRDPAVRDGDHSRPGTSESGGDPRDDLGLHAEAAELDHLLSAAPKHEGVANLEPHDALAGQQRLEAPPVDLPLRLLRAARVLLRHAQGALDHGHDLLRDQAVRHDEVRLLQLSHGRDRQQVRVPRASTDEGDGAQQCTRRGVLGEAREHVLIDHEVALRVEAPDLHHPARRLHKRRRAVLLIPLRAHARAQPPQWCTLWAGPQAGPGRGQAAEPRPGEGGGAARDVGSGVRMGRSVCRYRRREGAERDGDGEGAPGGGPGAPEGGGMRHGCRATRCRKPALTMYARTHAGGRVLLPCSAADDRGPAMRTGAPR